MMPSSQPGSSSYKQETVALGTSVVPQWYSAPYWPLLFSDGTNPAECVEELLVLPIWESLILQLMWKCGHYV